MGLKRVNGLDREKSESHGISGSAKPSRRARDPVGNRRGDVMIEESSGPLVNLLVPRRNFHGGQNLSASFQRQPNESAKD